MPLLVESELKPGWHRRLRIRRISLDEPVRPDDTLHLEIEVLEVRPSRSRSDQGVIKVMTTTLIQRIEPVQVSVGNLAVRRRPASTA